MTGQDKEKYMKKCRQWARSHLKEVHPKAESISSLQGDIKSSFETIKPGKLRHFTSVLIDNYEMRINRMTENLKKVKQARDFYRFISFVLIITCILIIIATL